MRFVRLKVSALLLFAVICLMLATPAGSRLNNRQVWESQHNQDEFEAWASGLRAVGFDVSDRQFQEVLWDLTNDYLAQRNRWFRPVSWLSEQLGFAQSWRMFSNPQTSPSRLWVELDEGDGFAPIFVVGSSEHTWNQDFFTHHRIRKLLGRIGRAGRAPEYNALGKWLARQAARDFPNAKTLRIRMYTWKTHSPGQGHTPVAEPEFGRPGGKFTQSKTFDLGGFRQ